MTENFPPVILILIQTLAILVILLLLYKAFIFSIFDPLFYYVLTQAFSIELGFIQIHNATYLANFIACQIFFALGFRLFAKKIGGKNPIDDEHLSFKGVEYKFWHLFTIFGALLAILANVYLISQQGILLLADSPTSAKVSAFTSGGGLGAVRRINWGLLTLINLSSLFLYAKTKENKYLIILLILVLIGLSGGTKSSLLLYISIIALLGLFKTFKESASFKRIEKLKIPIMVVGIIVALFILGINSLGFNIALQALLIRFLYFGDIILYYYNPEAVGHFQQLGPIDFVNYELNPILGLARIVPYAQPLGFEMVKFSLASSEIHDTVLGPNLPYYVKGHIFFGPIGALIYSFWVGMLIGYVRGLLRYSFKSYTQYILVIFTNMLIFSYAQDSSFTTNIFLDTLLFSLIPVFLSSLFLISPGKKVSLSS